MNTNKNHIKTGFKTPDNYFDTFENNLFEQLQLENKTGFTTPENYFDTLEKNVLNQVTPSKTKVISLITKKQLVYISTVAAAVLFSFFVLKPSDLQKTTFENIEYTVLEDYLTIEDIDLSANELAELYNIDSIDLNSISFSSIDESTILEYLSDEVISEDYFDNEL